MDIEKEQWAASINAFPWQFRAKVTVHRLGSFRRQGLLVKGEHYEEVAVAKERNYEIVGMHSKMPSSHKYVYNIRRVMEVLTPDNKF